MKKFLIIIWNIIKTKSYLIILVKVFFKIFDKQGSLNKKENSKWIQSNLANSENFLRKIDSAQYQLSLNTYKFFLKKKSVNLSPEQKKRIGGGGMYVLLNFLVSYLRPKNIVETGVAAGVSSHAILKAIKNNKKGHLYSSDLPIMRLANPYKIIGILVDKKLRVNWSLYLKGDKKNLKTIKTKINKIDLIHYDSEKRYHGREYVFQNLNKLINANTIIVMDDIQDNSFFYDFIKKNNFKRFKIFKYEKKYVGLVSNNKKLFKLN